MSGRRQHARFAVSNTEGSLMVARDVMVRASKAGELIAMDREPRAIGELATLEIVVNGNALTRQVRVTGCRPVVRRGSLLHEFTLEPVEDIR